MAHLQDSIGAFRRAMPDRIGWIVGLGTCLGMASQSAGFWMVGALVRTGGLDIQQATLMSTAEMVTIGILMLLISPSIHRWPHKKTMVFAILLAIAMQVLSAMVSGFVPLLAIRVASGIGFGLIYAIASAVGAAADDPKKAYAAAGVITLAVGTLFNPVVGFATEHSGHVGVFTAVSALCIALAIPLLALKFDEPRHAAIPTSGRVQGAPIRWVLAAGVIVIMGLFAIATNGVYIVIERVADTVGLSGTALGNGLTVVSLVGALGIPIAARLSKSAGGFLKERLGIEVGQAVPLTLSLLGIGACSAALVVSGSAASFYGLFTLWIIIYWLAYTYIFALSVIADPLGRMASAAGSILILLGGAGSAVAGAVTKHFGMPTFSAFVLASCVLAAILGVVLVRTLTTAKSPAAAA
jgi:MFS family permease